MTKVVICIHSLIKIYINKHDKIIITNLWLILEIILGKKIAYCLY